MKVVSCRPAWIKTSNRFTTLFAEAVQKAGWNVREFSWAPGGVFGPKVILLHWPDELFTSSNAFERSKVAFKIAMLQSARRFSDAESIVMAVRDRAPNDRKVHVQLGRIFAATGRFDRAAEEFLQVVDPSAGSAYVEAEVASAVTPLLDRRKR